MIEMQMDIFHDFSKTIQHVREENILYHAK